MEKAVQENDVVIHCRVAGTVADTPGRKKNILLLWVQFLRRELKTFNF